LKIFTLGSFFVEVDHEEGLVGLDFLATFVLLALDAAIATGEFSTESIGDIGDVPVLSE